MLGLLSAAITDKVFDNVSSPVLGAVSLSAPSLGPGPLNMPQGSNGEAGAAASCEAVSDLQSLGVLLYAMATGSAPFTWEDLPEQDLGAPSSDQDGETTAGQPELTVSCLSASEASLLCRSLQYSWTGRATMKGSRGT